jgi:hypothetical protein
MSKRLEVRAAVSFGVFRAGNVYEIDIEDDRIMSLLGVGYLEPTSDLEDDDDVRRNRSSELGVGDSGTTVVDGGDDLARSSEAEGVVDVADHPGPVSDAALGTSARVRGRKTSGVKDADRGAGTGQDGNTSSRVRASGRWANTES